MDELPLTRIRIEFNWSERQFDTRAIDELELFTMSGVGACQSEKWDRRV